RRVPKLAIMRIREPGWHLLTHHRRFDGLRPRPHAFIRQERHRRDAARAMTGLTVVLQDRQNILIKRDGGSLIGLSRRRRHLHSQCRYRREQNENENSSHTVLPS